MPPAHSPKPEVIIYAVAKAFNTTPESILSASQKMDVVVPREVCAFIMQADGYMRLPEIGITLRLDAGWLKKVIRNVRERARVDIDFAARIWEAKMILLQIHIIKQPSCNWAIPLTASLPPIQKEDAK